MPAIAHSSLSRRRAATARLASSLHLSPFLPSSSPKPAPDQIKRHTKEGQKHLYTLLLVPRASTLVSSILEEEGVLGDVNISSYDLQFIPIADDVISLERESAFKEVWVVGVFLYGKWVVC